MSDEEVLNAVKQTLSDVRMDRPVEAIERRGRARRRKRNLVGVAAGAGLAAVAALALALPSAGGQSGSAQSGDVATALTPAAFTLVARQDNTVKLTLHYQQVLDPAALQKALAKAGIPAVVKKDALCTPKEQELPAAKQVYWPERVDRPDGSTKEYTLVIAPAKMPPNSRLYFSVFAIRPGEDAAKAAQFLVSNDDPMTCRTLG